MTSYNYKIYIQITYASGIISQGATCTFFQLDSSFSYNFKSKDTPEISAVFLPFPRDDAFRYWLLNLKEKIRGTHVLAFTEVKHASKEIIISKELDDQMLLIN